MGTQPPSPKTRRPTNVYCGQTAGWIKMPLGTEVGHSVVDVVLDGDSALAPLKGNSPVPNFRPMSVVAKRLDGLRCHLVWRYGSAQATLYSMGAQVPREKGTAPHPIFGPCLLWQNGWIDQDMTWYGGKPRLRRRCVRWGRSSPPKRGTTPSFRFMSTVAKRLDGWRRHLV